jgi:hypothetical protein
MNNGKTLDRVEGESFRNPREKIISEEMIGVFITASGTAWSTPIQ